MIVRNALIIYPTLSSYLVPPIRLEKPLIRGPFMKYDSQQGAWYFEHSLKTHGGARQTYLRIH